MSQEAFKPDSLAASAFIAATTTANATAIPNGAGCQLYVSNEGTSPIRIGFGTASTAPTAVSATSGISMPPNTVRVFTLDQILLNQGGYVYAVASTGTATVGICRGTDGH